MFISRYNGKIYILSWKCFKNLRMNKADDIRILDSYLNIKVVDDVYSFYKTRKFLSSW